MPIHDVKQGECLGSIASHYVFGDPLAIWNDPANAELKKLRQNPMILMPGDQLMIPERPAKPPLKIATGKFHRFVIKRPQYTVRFRVLDEDEKAIPIDRLTLLVEGREKSLRAGGTEGVVEADVDARDTEGELTIMDAALETILRKLKLALGHLDPLTKTSGIQGRLHNLGYEVSISGELDEATRAVIDAFRTDEGLPAGELGEDLEAALLKAHGS